MSENNGHNGNGHGGAGGKKRTKRGESGLTELHEVRMLAKAVEKRWPITAEHREGVVGTFNEVMRNKRASRRERVAAARGMTLAEKQNQEDEHLETKLNRTIHHVHEIRVGELADDDLTAIILDDPKELSGHGSSNGNRSDIQPDSESGGGGATLPPDGPAPPA